MSKENMEKFLSGGTYLPRAPRREFVLRVEGVQEYKVAEGFTWTCKGWEACATKDFSKAG
jgi:hypothetical protein